VADVCLQYSSNPVGNTSVFGVDSPTGLRQPRNVHSSYVGLCGFLRGVHMRHLYNARRGGPVSRTFSAHSNDYISHKLTGSNGDRQNVINSRKLPICGAHIRCLYFVRDVQQPGKLFPSLHSVQASNTSGYDQKSDRGGSVSLLWMSLEKANKRVLRHIWNKSHGGRIGHRTGPPYEATESRAAAANSNGSLPDQLSPAYSHAYG
jgi:hypothetical protein